MRANPPWADRILSRWRVRLEGVGFPLPSPTPSRRRVPAYAEYGCGHYGCVYPASEGTVFKLTTDASEAAFVVAAMEIASVDKHWPEGMIRYFKIVQLGGESYRRRPVYALHRAEAHDVGFLSWGAPPELRSSWREFETIFTFYLSCANAARKVVVKSKNPLAVVKKASSSERYRTGASNEIYARGGLGDKLIRIRRWAPPSGAARLRYFADACEELAQAFYNQPVAYLVGGALEYYISAGLLLADVHYGNIGLVELPDFKDPQPVITDPGHMVPLSPRWTEVQVPVLE